ncbi:hypothetical protein B0H10DRAFT_1041261 [Mycena sp. CBHHK59/15]|nr:hypothetical protein B0H10DRAFT_1041261 [Mycena sp. CBHHK59/15]
MTILVVGHLTHPATSGTTAHDARLRRRLPYADGCLTPCLTRTPTSTAPLSPLLARATLAACLPPRLCSPLTSRPFAGQPLVRSSAEHALFAGPLMPLPIPRFLNAWYFVASPSAYGAPTRVEVLPPLHLTLPWRRVGHALRLTVPQPTTCSSSMTPFAMYRVTTNSIDARPTFSTTAMTATRLHAGVIQSPTLYDGQTPATTHVSTLDATRGTTAAHSTRGTRFSSPNPPSSPPPRSATVSSEVTPLPLDACPCSSPSDQQRA